LICREGVPVRLPQSSAGLSDELLAFFVEFFVQPFRERRRATIKNIGKL
jgi:hypothetical protein